MTNDNGAPGTCDFVEYHDDMYPEFAPEPLSVACTRQATHLVVGVDHSDVEPRVFALSTCLEHAADYADIVNSGHLPPGESDIVFGEMLTTADVLEEWRQVREAAHDRAAEQRAGNYHGRNVL